MGTPPTAVFVAKLAVFSAAADGSLGWLVVLAAVNTVASLFYYLRWFGPAVRSNSPTPTSSRARPSLPLLTAHTAAVTSLLLGIGAGAWLTLVVAA